MKEKNKRRGWGRREEIKFSSEEPSLTVANGMCYELTSLYPLFAPSSPLQKINIEGKGTFLTSRYFKCVNSTRTYISLMRKTVIRRRISLRCEKMKGDLVLEAHMEPHSGSRWSTVLAHWQGDSL